MYNSVQGYGTKMPRDYNVDIRRGQVHYALMPVWLLTTKYKGKNRLFAVNGQTGKTVGDLPTSMGRLAALFGGLTAVLTFVLSAVSMSLLK